MNQIIRFIEYYCGTDKSFSLPQNQRDKCNLSIIQTIAKQPASTNNNETIVYNIAVLSNIKRLTNLFVIIVNIGENSRIDRVFSPINNVKRFIFDDK